MPRYGSPAGFMCACGKAFRGRPAYYRMMRHVAATGHSTVNRTTNSLGGKKRKLTGF